MSVIGATNKLPEPKKVEKPIPGPAADQESLELEAQARKTQNAAQRGMEKQLSMMGQIEKPSKILFERNLLKPSFTKHPKETREDQRRLAKAVLASDVKLLHPHLDFEIISQNPGQLSRFVKVAEKDSTILYTTEDNRRFTFGGSFEKFLDESYNFVTQKALERLRSDNSQISSCRKIDGKQVVILGKSPASPETVCSRFRTAYAKSEGEEKRLAVAAGVALKSCGPQSDYPPNWKPG